MQLFDSKYIRSHLTAQGFSSIFRIGLHPSGDQMAGVLIHRSLIRIRNMGRLNKSHCAICPGKHAVLFLALMEDIHHHRPLLFSLAYDILGEVQEAEDIVQDVFESWFSKQPEVQFPKAYLSRAVVNKSIDRLEALKKTREVYKGPWLPVPIVSPIASPDEKAQSGDPLPYALLSVLEKLNPVERAAFILRHAFDFPYSEISEMCNLPEENARQLVHRAQENYKDHAYDMRLLSKKDKGYSTLSLRPVQGRMPPP